MYPEQNYSTPQDPNAYNFITDPTPPPKKSFGGGSSLAVRLIVVLGGVLALLVIIVIVKNLLGGSSNNVPALLSVAKQQAQIVHISSAATKESQPLEASNRRTAVTTELAVASAQKQLLSYVKTQKKLNKKNLTFRFDKTIDTQLASAASAGTYDATYRQVLNEQLTIYRQELRNAFTKTDGPKGRELLNKQYDGAGLLLKQLEVN